MKRLSNSLLFAAVTIVVGVLLAALSHRVAPQLTPQVNAEIEAVAETVREEAAPLVAMIPAPVQALAERAMEVIAPVSTAKASASTILLSEPVIILGPTPAQNTALPRGTQVALLKYQGQYAQVRHQSRVITIPRAATVNGVYRLN